MKCDDCVNHAECETESKTNLHKREIMWIIGFWSNAEKRCVEFKATDGDKR